MGLFFPCSNSFATDEFENTSLAQRVRSLPFGVMLSTYSLRRTESEDNSKNIENGADPLD